MRFFVGTIESVMPCPYPKPVMPFDADNSVESFGISPDGQSITIATWEQFFSIMVTEDLPTR